MTYQDTSRIAYQSVSVGELGQRVLDFVQSAGSHGATCDEAMNTLGLTHQSASPRFTDLQDRGLIVRTDRRRMTRSGRPAAIYVLAQFAGLFSSPRPNRADVFRAVIRAAMTARDTGNWTEFDKALGALPAAERRKI